MLLGARRRLALNQTLQIARAGIAKSIWYAREDRRPWFPEEMYSCLKVYSGLADLRETKMKLLLRLRHSSYKKLIIT